MQKLYVGQKVKIKHTGRNACCAGGISVWDRNVVNGIHTIYTISKGPMGKSFIFVGDWGNLLSIEYFIIEESCVEPTYTPEDLKRDCEKI